MSFKEEVLRTICQDPLGYSLVTYRDAVLYIAQGVTSSTRIREYVEAGIGPELAGKIELDRD